MFAGPGSPSNNRCRRRRGRREICSDPSRRCSAHDGRAAAAQQDLGPRSGAPAADDVLPAAGKQPGCPALRSPLSSRRSSNCRPACRPSRRASPSFRRRILQGQRQHRRRCLRPRRCPRRTSQHPSCPRRFPSCKSGVPAGAQRLTAPQALPPVAATPAPLPPPAMPVPAVTPPPASLPPAAPAVTATPVPPSSSNRPDIMPIPAPLPTANYPMFTGTADGRSQLIRLRDLQSKALHLEGAAPRPALPSRPARTRCLRRRAHQPPLQLFERRRPRRRHPPGVPQQRADRLGRAGQGERTEGAPSSPSRRPCSRPTTACSSASLSRARARKPARSIATGRSG